MNIPRLVEKGKLLARQIYKWFRRRKWWQYLLLVVTLFAVWGYWQLFYIFPPKRIGTFTFLGIWLFQFVVGAGAAYAIYRTWPERANPFARWTILALCSSILLATASFVLVFMARGVKFTWKFSITLFVGVFLWNVVMVPLILYLIRGPQHVKKDKPNEPPKSGELPPEHWMAQFEDLRRRIDEIREKLNKPDN